MPQHPPIGVCTLSSPDGVCSLFISGSTKIKRCKKCGFWDIIRVNKSRAVPGGCGQARGAPASAGLGHLPRPAPWGRLIQPHRWCPQPGDVSQRWTVSICSPFPGAALRAGSATGVPDAAACPGAARPLAPALPCTLSLARRLSGTAAQRFPAAYGLGLGGGEPSRYHGSPLPGREQGTGTPARGTAGCGQRWAEGLDAAQGRAGTAGACGNPTLAEEASIFSKRPRGVGLPARLW